MPSIKKALVAVATVKPHSGSSSSKIQNFSKTLTHNTALLHPKDRFLALLHCLKRKRLSKELTNLLQAFYSKLRSCREEILKKSLKLLFFPPYIYPLFFSSPCFPFFLHYTECYSIQLNAPLHLPALNKMPARLSDVPSCLTPSIMGKAHAMGTMSHCKHTLQHLYVRKYNSRQVSYPTAEEKTPLHNHSCSIIPKGSLLCHQGEQVFSHWLKFYSMGQRFEQAKKKNNPKKITESREETISTRRRLCQKKDKITHY